MIDVSDVLYAGVTFTCWNCGGHFIKHVEDTFEDLQNADSTNYYCCGQKMNFKVKIGMRNMSKGELMKLAYGENYTGVDSAVPQGWLDKMNKMCNMNMFFWVYSYNDEDEPAGKTIFGKPINLAEKILLKLIGS